MEEVCEGKDFNFPKEEEKILEFWTRIDAFKTQLKRTEGKPEYIFYDGPPFATGLPHYGHILAGTIKDIVTRYKSIAGYHVTRRFGWDCHGLPVEYEIDQKLNIRTREDVLNLGIDNYNEECRSIVMRYASEWETIITRVGRWIDFKNDYKTLDLKFMESVWWVFKELYDKGLVYRGYKVMPYSIGCNTPLSNFEAGLNYKDVSDPAIMISFPLVDDVDNASIVAWTTTPWTLPSNLALCVNDNFTYLKLRNKETGSVLIVAESRAFSLPSKKKSKPENPPSTETKDPEVKVQTKDKKEKEKKGNSKKNAPDTNSQSENQAKVDLDTYEILSSLKGSDLVGKKYKPMFDYFNEFSSVAFKIISDNYVTDDSGTGVVHCAPAFGEDDYRVCINAKIIDKGEEIPTSVDFNGRFTDKITAFKGKNVKDADKEIIATIKGIGRLVNSGNIVHSYPFCWRSDTPLIYKSVPSWFVAVEKIKDKLLANNEKTYWVPDYVKEKRFHNWLENARDWAVSRSRFWGTPLPIWISEDGKEIQVIGSIQQLKDLSGQEATDLHRHRIDHITIPSKRGKDFPPLKRVEDVFDCWFESGSMPYGYIHYPFENTDLFEKNFPGDFVAEGLDQTRGWFYTLMVLSTALFDKPAFKNLICNGLVLAEDGKKMSKRLKNYPPPSEIVDSYGADALRLYLINSPVVRAEPLRFKKEGVFAVVKDVFLPWYNAFRFFVQNALRLKIENNENFIPIDISQLKEMKTLNTLDEWIISSTSSLSDFVYQEMESYRLYTVVPYLLKFIDNLTNIYVRFNRKRLKGKTGDEDCKIALSTLYYVLVTVCKAMSPFTPFFCENLFQKLRKVSNIKEESVHYCDFPKAQSKSDNRIEESVNRMMRVTELARNIREKNNKPLKKPLKEMIIVHPDEDFLEDITGKLKEYVLEELNIRTIIPCSDKLKFSTLRAEPDFSLLGKKLGKSMGVIAKEVKNVSVSEILDFEKKGELTIQGHVLKAGEIKILRSFKAPEGMNVEDLDASGDGDVLVILDLRADESLLDAGIAREMVNRIQKLRKKCGLEPTDSIEIFFESVTADSNISRVLNTQAVYFKEALGSPLLPKSLMPSHSVEIYRELFSGISGENFIAILAKPSLCFIRERIVQLCKGDEIFAANIEVALLARDPSNLRVELTKNKNKALIAIEGQGECEVELGEHFYLTVGEYYSLVSSPQANGK